MYLLHSLLPVVAVLSSSSSSSLALLFRSLTSVYYFRPPYEPHYPSLSLSYFAAAVVVAAPAMSKIVRVDD